MKGDRRGTADDQVVYNVGEFRCNARGDRYASSVTVHLVGREYIKQRGAERKLATGPDVSAIDMWSLMVIDGAVREDKIA